LGLSVAPVVADLINPRNKKLRDTFLGVTCSLRCCFFELACGCLQTSWGLDMTDFHRLFKQNIKKYHCSRMNIKEIAYLCGQLDFKAYANVT